MKRPFNILPMFAALLLIVGCQEALVAPDAAEGVVARSTDATTSPPAALRLPGSDHGGRPLTASLTGEAEVPVTGDVDGTGSAIITLNQGQGEVCFELSVQDIAPATAAHIHVGTADVAGPVVVGLDPPTDGTSSGCVTGVSKSLIKAIRQSPEEYYVNVHNADFPGGAIRGQLEK